MGANAQTTVQKFVDGAVLTAAQQNFSAGTGVPVFATTVTRDAAFGGANKVLAEGQLCYLESTNVTQYYDGAAWATVGPAAAGALVRVGGGTLSLSSTAFSSIFSATYDAYKIVVSNLDCSASDNQTLQLGSTTTGYYFAIPSSNPSSTFSGLYNSNVASFTLTYAAASVVGGYVLDIVNPFLTARTIIHGNGVQMLTNGNLGSVSGWLNNATSYTAFTLAPASGTFTGTVNVYGYSLS